jgi:hypothetical protein
VSECADSFGEMSASIFSSASSPLDWVRLVNTSDTRVRSWPAFSIATIVLSNVGGEGSCAIAWISSRCLAMPASNAGMKSPSLILSNGGR